ncbi:hypothetical protein GCM10010191_66250 [Actinomadura vinacea]|uniref:Uncharacterized protein n=1 Tax=Actinomadura vinacea TaxID=115336 RepID=A0ABN3JUV7_9ACTN
MDLALADRFDQVVVAIAGTPPVDHDREEAASGPRDAAESKGNRSGSMGAMAWSLVAALPDQCAGRPGRDCTY